MHRTYNCFNLSAKCHCNVRVYVCVCITQISHSGIVDRTTSVLWSFERSTPTLIGCKQFGDVMWPWPIYSEQKWTLWHKSCLFAIFGWFVRKLLEKSKKLQCPRIRKLGMGYLTTPKWAPNFTLFFSCGVENVNNAKNQIFHFQLIKLCYKIVPINKFQRKSNCFEFDAYLRFLQRFQCADVFQICIPETTALICMYHLTSLLNGYFAQIEA